ncbi:MAG: aldehyde dehydrogenase family protein [Deltaproteobacteria bacterium]|nr:MAG: aldehyde dehydrogenase family protein [Deltaproteobacteria bacterium]
MSLTGESRLLIDGKLVNATGGRSYPNVNPATEEVIGQVADATREDMDRAIAAARRAFDTTDWSTNLAKRAKCLRQLHAALTKHKEELRPQIVAEVGAPIMLTYAVQQDSCIQDMLWDIECAEKYGWEDELGVHEFFGMKSRRLVRREPLGVAGLITPWNFPFMLNLSKVVPALMAGCTAVLKAAPDTPWSATWIGKLIAEETELPPGVLNIVTARDPAEVGDQLTGDPRVDVISFTGSTAIGKHIMRRCADGLKRVFLELGGKSAQIYLDDAALKNLVPAGGSMICMHGGQGCAISTRMLLPRSCYAECVEALKAAYENLPYGDPTVMGNVMGPLINAKQRERVLGYIEKGKAEGAKCLTGGGRPAKFGKGYFVEPTLFVDVDPDATIAQEEIFGPVLSVIPYDSEEDAVRIANNSRYGLSGSVFAGSLERAMSVAKRIRTGTLSLNGGQWFGPDSPFGGYKESGIGREHGVAGFEEYLQIKTIGYPA